MFPFMVTTLLSVKQEVVSAYCKPSSPLPSSAVLGAATLDSLFRFWKRKQLLWFIILTVFISSQGDSVRLNQRFSITAQLLVLYYILSYEEALLANTKTLGKSTRAQFVHRESDSPGKSSDRGRKDTLGSSRLDFRPFVSYRGAKMPFSSSQSFPWLGGFLWSCFLSSRGVKNFRICCSVETVFVWSQKIICLKYIPTGDTVL